jgi:hypothetical protein
MLADQLSDLQACAQQRIFFAIALPVAVQRSG